MASLSLPHIDFQRLGELLSTQSIISFLKRTDPVVILSSPLYWGPLAAVMLFLLIRRAYATAWLICGALGLWAFIYYVLPRTGGQTDLKSIGLFVAGGVGFLSVLFYLVFVRSD
ncbi:hypothetical protein G4V39_11080 [Thermosulfuriphilus ammonigenes]|uniref:Uncharacterized protein n=1 Tax=Thermosulfuriphilus ammonigenes TaxID=1936021 RepID=A0A6G7PZ13_9BACT|nr:hypothetical protein [Thermosulfuriphilus ammonigenes]MBA2849106.1 hypothetical protein [Thermosulfuriphilus ammonigenes]QIJ72786.1 hypothetical protein G4V39_11080 [Thermosulfuriphilus ammonigenes]